MIRFESSIDIDRPIEDVFPYVADVGHEPEWHTDVVAARLDPPGPLRVGQTFHGTFKAMGRTSEAAGEVLTFEPGRRIQYHFREPIMGLAPLLTYAFEPTGSGTRFTRRVEAETSGPMRILGVLMRPMMARRNAGFVRNLKRRLEAAA